MEEAREVIIEEKKPLLRRTSTIRRTVKTALQQLALPTTTYIMKSMGGDILSPARSPNPSLPDVPSLANVRSPNPSISEARSAPNPEDGAKTPDGKGGKSVVSFLDAMGHGRVLSSSVLGMKLNQYWMKECRYVTLNAVYALWHHRNIYHCMVNYGIIALDTLPFLTILLLVI